MPKKKVDFITDAFVRDYIRDVLKLRSSKTGIAEFNKQFNSLMQAVLKDAAKQAKKRRRKTILPKAVATAFEKHVGKHDLDWKEIFQQLLKEPASDLGKISQAINDRLDKLKAKK